MRVDKKKNVAKVTKVALTNPLLTRDEIAKQAGVSQGTASNVLSKLDQYGRKDDRILGVCEKDFEIVKLGQAIIADRLKDKTETDKMRTFEIAQTIEKSEKRYMLFKGDVTKADGGLKGFAELSDLELMNMLNEGNK